MGTTSSRNKPPPHLRRANTVPSLGHTSHNHSTNTVPATADDAAAFMDGFEQLVRLCENKDKPEADAQEVVDKLDQVKSDCRFLWIFLLSSYKDFGGGPWFAPTQEEAAHYVAHEDLQNILFRSHLAHRSRCGAGKVERDALQI